MATLLIEHAQAVSAAIQAAKADGLTLDFDLSYDYDGFVEHIDMDLWDGNEYITAYETDR